MARIRTLKPEFWTNESLSAQPEATHLLAAALLNYADDEGYFNANVALVKAACSPIREPSVSIQCSLEQLADIGYLRFGLCTDGRRYGRVVKFDDHQRVNRPTESRIKGLPINWEDSSTTHGSLTETSPLEWNREQGKEQGTGKARERDSFDPGAVEGLNREAWAQWVSHRKAIKKPIAPHSQPLAAKQMAALGDRQQAEVERAIAGGWQGLHPETQKGATSKPASTWTPPKTVAEREAEAEAQGIPFETYEERRKNASN